jgi:hypothetical protein
LPDSRRHNFALSFLDRAAEASLHGLRPRKAAAHPISGVSGIETAGRWQGSNHLALLL